MNVTKENFKEAADEIVALLPTAAFLSFDEEMTGISIAGQTESIGDTPAKRYSKMRNVASRYNIIQFGLALFHRKECGASTEEDSEHYEAHVYNFYLFPEMGPINMDGSAIAFNRNHGMDWNTWIREGIPYVNRATSNKLKDALLPSEEKKGDKKDAPKNKGIKLTKDSDIEMTDSAIAALKAWLSDDAKKEETEFEVMTTNAYIRRFLYETFAADFPSLIVESRPTATRGVSTFVALRLSEEQKTDREAKLRLEKEAEFARKVGFTKVFNAMAEAKKPIVGHAVMFDLLFALSHCEGPLPEAYSDYKALVNDLFPSLFDTQLLAKSEPFKFKPQAADADPAAKKEHRFGSMALGAVYKVFVEEAAAAKAAGKATIEITFASGHDRYGPDCTAFHEAGYDAYVTGYAFAHMAKEALRSENVSKLGSRTTMFRSLFHFNLSGEDDLISKGVYVHTSGLKGRDANEFKSAFADIKIPGEDKVADMEIRWIDDDSAFAVFPETCKESVTTMLGIAAGSTGDDSGGLKFTSWEDWLRTQGAAHTCSEADATEPPLKRARIAA